MYTNVFIDVHIPTRFRRPAWYAGVAVRGKMQQQIITEPILHMYFHFVHPSNPSTLFIFYLFLF
jgi:hypothetical protein